MKQMEELEWSELTKSTSSSLYTSKYIPLSKCLTWKRKVVKNVCFSPIEYETNKIFWSVQDLIWILLLRTNTQTHTHTHTRTHTHKSLLTCKTGTMESICCSFNTSYPTFVTNLNGKYEVAQSLSYVCTSPRDLTVIPFAFVGKHSLTCIFVAANVFELGSYK